MLAGDHVRIVWSEDKSDFYPELATPQQLHQQVNNSLDFILAGAFIDVLN